MKTICAAYAAWVAAIFMLFGGLSILGGFATEMGVTPMEDKVNFRDAGQLAALWEGRRAGRPFFLAGQFCWAFGWLLLITPVQALANLLGGDERSGTMLLRICFLAPAVINMVDFTFQAGTISVTDSISYAVTSDPLYVPDPPWRDPAIMNPLTPLQSLELTYRVARSRSMWLSALDGACVTVGFAAAAFLSFGSRHTSMCTCWKVLTYINILVGFVGFLSGVARGVEFGDPNLLKPINGLWFLTMLSLFLPAWLIALGHQLKTKDEIGYSAGGNRVGGGGGGSSSTDAYPQGAEMSGVGVNVA